MNLAATRMVYGMLLLFSIAVSALMLTDTVSQQLTEHFGDRWWAQLAQASGELPDIGAEASGAKGGACGGADSASGHGGGKGGETSCSDKGKGGKDRRSFHPYIHHQKMKERMREREQGELRRRRASERAEEEAAAAAEAEEKARAEKGWIRGWLSKSK